MENKHTDKESRQKVMVFLNREQVDLLDKIGKDAVFSGGKKLSRVKIIACLVDLANELEISGEGISSVEELKKIIKEKMVLLGLRDAILKESKKKSTTISTVSQVKKTEGVDNA